MSSGPEKGTINGVQIVLRSLDGMEAVVSKAHFLKEKTTFLF